MTELKEGMTAPTFELTESAERKIFLNDFSGKGLILYFYPKDDTPGCTLEAKDFSTNYKKILSLGYELIGVSKDDPITHNKFREKYCLTIPLVSDIDGKVCEDYGVWKEKSMYGKKYMGIERSTFILDGSGKITKIWRNVKVEGHVDEIIKSIIHTQSDSKSE